MKVRKVISRGKIKKTGGVFSEVNFERTLLLDMQADNTEVELVALVDEEPERELVVPEGALWERNHINSWPAFDLVVLEGIVAHVFFSGPHEAWAWRSHCDEGGHGLLTKKKAKRYVEESLADRGLYGFGWREKEEEVPECVVYCVSHALKWPNGTISYFGQYYRNSDAASKYAETLKKDSASQWITYHGLTSNGEMRLIERWERGGSDDKK